MTNVDFAQDFPGSEPCSWLQAVVWPVVCGLLVIGSILATDHLSASVAFRQQGTQRLLPAGHQEGATAPSQTVQTAAVTPR